MSKRYFHKKLYFYFHRLWNINIRNNKCNNYNTPGEEDCGAGGINKQQWVFSMDPPEIFFWQMSNKKLRERKVYKLSQNNLLFSWLFQSVNSCSTCSTMFNLGNILVLVLVQVVLVTSSTSYRITTSYAH
jgi:hypothetical protein